MISRVWTTRAVFGHSSARWRKTSLLVRGKCTALILSEGKIRHRSQYAGENWKRSFISTFRSTVHTNLSRKRSFLKTLFKPEELENTDFAFNLDGNHFKMELFENDDMTIIIWPSCPSFPQSGDCSVLEFLWLNVKDGKHSHEFSEWIRRFQISPTYCLNLPWSWFFLGGEICTGFVRSCVTRTRTS